MATTSAPTIQILALGMPRTGTFSMKQALEQLGYAPTYHGLDTLARPHESVIWNDLLCKKYYQHQRLPLADLERLFHGHAAVTDMCFYLWDDLLDAYPNAKLILVERDTETWFRSFNRVLMPQQFTWRSSIFKHCIEPLLGTQFVAMGEMMQLHFFDARSQAEFRANARDKYTAYYRDVRAAAKARGRPMLEYSLGEGWEPLCGFLGKEVPDIEFPRANEEKAILEFWAQERRKMYGRFRVAVLWYLLPLLAIVLAVGLYFVVR